ncbi:unnamed protein product [Acanthoscelides obtectus]|nr:unnamed protein product [Acanthoscelides obtectus]CAK1645956.1 Zinc finger protein DZIP1 [Acanthoscelides obtectus]
MSQLAVEYLLFCKRYLDNTVVLLKKDVVKAKEELREMKSYIQELEAHLMQIQKHAVTATFKCDKCLKVFLSENYLNSHIKRRHSDDSKMSVNADKPCETDQLQSEIKELKERLNATEKILKDKSAQVEMKENQQKNDEVREIYAKFEKFKEQVENEISTLQTEKKFYEDKYNRLFDLVMQTKNSESQMSLSQKKPDVSHASSESDVKRKNLQIVTFKDNALDSDKSKADVPKPKKLDVVTVQESYCGRKEDSKFEKKDVEIDNESVVEEVDDKIERKISEISSNLENKISTSLVTIQNQMESFWTRLSEIQISSQGTAKSKPISSMTDRQEFENKHEIQSIQKQENSMVKPKIKPRTKLSNPTRVQDNIEVPSAAEKLKTQLDQYISHQEDTSPGSKISADENEFHEEDDEILMAVPEKKNVYLNRQDIETKSKTQKVLKQSAAVATHMQLKVQELSNDSEESEEEGVPEKVLSKKSSKKSIDRRLPLEDKKGKVHEKLKDLVRMKFEDIGISLDWQGIPNKSFERGLEIIKHQANMDKKRYDNYSSVRKSIEKTLNVGGCKEKLKKKKKIRTPLTDTQKKLSTLMRIRSRKKPREQPPEPKPIKTIKHKELFQTDSESDHPEICESTKINQLLPSKTTLELLQNTDSELQSITSLDDKPGPIRPASSTAGVVAKKKVAFNVTPSDTGSAQPAGKHEKSSSLSDFDLSLV